MEYFEIRDVLTNTSYLSLTVIIVLNVLGIMFVTWSTNVTGILSQDFVRTFYKLQIRVTAGTRGRGECHRERCRFPYKGPPPALVINRE